MRKDHQKTVYYCNCCGKPIDPHKAIHSTDNFSKANWKIKPENGWVDLDLDCYHTLGGKFDPNGDWE